MSDPKGIDALFAPVKKAFGRRDILVNSAAVAKRVGLDRWTMADTDAPARPRLPAGRPARRGTGWWRTSRTRWVTGAWIDVSGSI